MVTVVTVTISWLLTKKTLPFGDVFLLGARTDSNFFTKISRNFKTFQITEYQ